MAAFVRVQSCKAGEEFSVGFFLCHSFGVVLADHVEMSSDQCASADQILFRAFWFPFPPVRPAEGRFLFPVVFHVAGVIDPCASDCVCEVAVGSHQQCIILCVLGRVMGERPFFIFDLPCPFGGDFLDSIHVGVGW